MKRFIIFAPNVGVGGGLVLLRALLKAWPADCPIIAILDERGRSALTIESAEFPIHWVRSSVVGRWRAERLLAGLAEADDVVFCFHNLPPVMPVQGRILCYVHNPNLVGLVPKSYLRGWVRIRYAIERFIAAKFSAKIDRYIIQTPTMAAALLRTHGPNAAPIDIMPFVDLTRMPQRHVRYDAVPEGQAGSDRECEWDFIYVSDGAIHKNHPKLFAAWELLAEEGYFPKLALTLHPQRDVDLRNRLSEIVAEKALNIVDLGQLPHQNLLEAYGKARALLFASYSESFGIPLIEAQAAGLPILAAELDFVRDVCEPAMTFDPHSARSIARAVKRFLGCPANPAIPGAEAFVAALVDLGAVGKS